MESNTAQVQDIRDLKNLCEVSWGLYHSTIPKLYASIAIPTPDEWHLSAPEVGLFLRNRRDINSHLQYVKGIEFVADFHVRLLSRCIPEIDSEDEVEDGDDGDDGHDDHGGDELDEELYGYSVRSEQRKKLHKPFLDELESCVVPFLDRLKEDNLRHFG